MGIIVSVTMRPQSPLPAAAATALLMIMGIRHSVSGQDDVGLPAGSDAILSSPYVDSFSCEGQAYGYFADVQNNCEVFHICYPLTDETGRITEYLKWSFFCGNGTVFDQGLWSATTLRTPSPARSRPACTGPRSTAWSRTTWTTTRAHTITLSYKGSSSYIKIWNVCWSSKCPLINSRGHFSSLYQCVISRVISCCC